MGAQGTQTQAVEQAARRQRVKDTAGCICAQAIDTRLRTLTVEDIQRDYDLSAVQAAEALAAVRANRQRIDPYGDWR